MVVQTYKQPPSRAKKYFKRFVLGVVGLIALSLTIDEIRWLSLTPEQQVAETAQNAKLKADRAAKADQDAKLKQQALQKTASAKQSEVKSQLSALDKMAIVFKGGYTKDQIERETTTVLRLFDQSLSDINYEHLANVLLSQSDSIKPNTEMDILVCMEDLKRGSGTVKLDIPYAAAMCATSISTGN